MVSISEALELIKDNIPESKTEEISVVNALNRVLAEDVFSPINMPSFNQSAMDGYAVHFSTDVLEYVVVGEVAAGSSNNPTLSIGEAARIFTGAMVPDSANTVIQQEVVKREEDKIRFTTEVATGKNIRLAGEQIKVGGKALAKGTVVTPAAIGFLSGLGITTISVIKQPNIALITTGNELVKPGNVLKPGQIYESNSGMLCAAMEDYGYTNYKVTAVADNYEETRNRISAAIEEADVVILTGGISVGDYDYVAKALEEIGVRQLFHKVVQKPGKPVYFGRTSGTMIAALPGNPAAALICFYRYVLPTLNCFSGKGFEGLKQKQVALSHAYSIKGTRPVFLKAFVENDRVTLLDGQSSAMLYTFAMSNAIVYVPASNRILQEGDLVETFFL